MIARRPEAVHERLRPSRPCVIRRALREENLMHDSARDFLSLLEPGQEIRYPRAFVDVFHFELVFRLARGQRGKRGRARDAVIKTVCGVVRLEEVGYADTDGPGFGEVGELREGREGEAGAETGVCCGGRTALVLYAAVGFEARLEGARGAVCNGRGDVGEEGFDSGIDVGC